jgi:hypothetical protein
MRIAARGYGVEGKVYMHEPIDIADNTFVSQSVDFYNPIVKIISYIGCLILGYVAIVLIFV